LVQAFDNAKQRDTLLALLHASRERFLASFAGMSEEEARVRPDSDSWSVLDCVEHICVAESGMCRSLKSGQRPRSADLPNREERFLAFAADRGTKRESPEAGRPTGRFATLAEAAQQFRSIRQGLIALIEENQADLRATEVTHPHAVVGVVSSYEMVIIMARHTDRHAAQIEEVRSSPAFNSNTVTRS